MLHKTEQNNYLQSNVGKKTMGILQVFTVRYEEPMLLVHVDHAVFYCVMLKVTHETEQGVQLFRFFTTFRRILIHMHVWSRFIGQLFILFHRSRASALSRWLELDDFDSGNGGIGDLIRGSQQMRSRAEMLRVSSRAPVLLPAQSTAVQDWSAREFARLP